MTLNKALHIKIDESLERELKRLAAERAVSVGELVRQAVRSVYRIGLEGLSAKQHAALSAYEAGYISLQKLAEEVAMDPLRLRKWLTDNGFEVWETFAVSDADHV